MQLSPLNPNVWRATGELQRIRVVKTPSNRTSGLRAYPTTSLRTWRSGLRRGCGLALSINRRLKRAGANLLRRDTSMQSELAAGVSDC